MIEYFQLMVSVKQKQLLAVRIEYTQIIFKTYSYDTLHISIPADKKEPCLSLKNQVRIEIPETETKSSTHFSSYQNWDNPNPDMPRPTLHPIENKRRKKWPKEDCKEIL